MQVILSQQLDAIFVTLKLQLQNHTREPGAICCRNIQGFQTCLKLDTILLRQKLYQVATTKIACVNRPLTH